MKKKGQRCVLIGLGLLFLTGMGLWAGIYFAIYYPLLYRDWTPANCTITALNSYQTYDYSTNSHATVILYTAQIHPFNATLPYFGYACETPFHHADLVDTSGDGNYPYLYVDCEGVHLDKGKCREMQVFQPKWMCLGYENSQPRYQIGDMDACKYYINGNAHNIHLNYPNSDSSFIELLFQADIYIPTGQYYALWVIPFGLMGGLSTILCICMAFGIPLGWLSDPECEKYKDFCVRFVCCRRQKLPKCVEKLGEELVSIQPAPVIVWLYMVRRHAEIVKVRPHFVREIADYLI